MVGVRRRTPHRMTTPETKRHLIAAAAAAEDKKAEEIRILALDPAESSLTDYFLICNGTNERQNVAIGDEIEFQLKRDFGLYPNSVEGRRHADWILLDYVHFVVHIFSPEKRAYYGLERLRKSARTLTVSDLTRELAARISAVRTASEQTRQVKTAHGGARVAATRKPAPSKPAAKKPAPKRKIAAKKQPVKKALAKKTAAPKKAAPKKSAVKKSAARNVVAKKSAKKSPAKKNSAPKKKR